MTITLNLSSETENKLREKAARRGQTLEGFLEMLVQETVALNPSPLTSKEWIARFQAWVASHQPLSTLADDSRESIYEGRGE